MIVSIDSPLVPVEIPLGSPAQIGESDYSNSLEEFPNTKEKLPGDFVLKHNTIGEELEDLALEVDPFRFRVFSLRTCGAMLDFYAPIPLDHFSAELSLPLDPAFCDFLNTIRSQPPIYTQTELGTSSP